MYIYIYIYTHTHTHTHTHILVCTYVPGVAIIKELPQQGQLAVVNDNLEIKSIGQLAMGHTATTRICITLCRKYKNLYWC